MQKIVLMLTPPHSLLCTTCVHGEPIKTEAGIYAYFCHERNAINTGDECSLHETMNTFFYKKKDEI